VLNTICKIKVYVWLVRLRLDADEGKSHERQVEKIQQLHPTNFWLGKTAVGCKTPLQENEPICKRSVLI